MKSKRVTLGIESLLGFCDLNGESALNLEQIQALEEYINECNISHNEGEDLVADAIYDKLIDILSHINSESELLKTSWESSDIELDLEDDLIVRYPMFSIQTVKSYSCDELRAFVKRLSHNKIFDIHLSVKLNGHGIRLGYSFGKFKKARSRATASEGLDRTNQLSVVLKRSSLDYLEELSDVESCQIRGEWLLPLRNMERAREFNSSIVSAFTGVSSLGKASASEEEWDLLDFVAYEFIADGVSFNTKEEEYEFLQSLGFETPFYWVVNDLSPETFISELPEIVSECEDALIIDAVYNYAYYSDGIVLRINDNSYFNLLGDSGGKFRYGNIALKVGYWEQNFYTGYIQTIYWTQGKTKLSPVAIIAEEPDMIEFNDFGYHPYITDLAIVSNYKSLGVVTSAGNRVRRVPLYEPCNMVILDAYQGWLLNFRYGGESGVVPCFDDGTPLIEGKLRDLLQSGKSRLDEYDEDYYEEVELDYYYGDDVV